MASLTALINEIKAEVNLSWSLLRLSTYSTENSATKTLTNFEMEDVGQKGSDPVMAAVEPSLSASCEGGGVFSEHVFWIDSIPTERYHYGWYSIFWWALGGVGQYLWTDIFHFCCSVLRILIPEQKKWHCIPPPPAPFYLCAWKELPQCSPLLFLYVNLFVHACRPRSKVFVVQFSDVSG